MNHWRRELVGFGAHLAADEHHDYVSWQPTKWQALTGIADLLVRECRQGHPEGGSAIELGCGAAISTGGPVPRLVQADFFAAGRISELGPADVVCHVGVIEHFSPHRQREFLRLSADLSHRWILIGFPNEPSPVFRSYLEVATRNGGAYDDQHQDIDVPALVEECVGVTDRLRFGFIRYYLIETRSA
jgi:hypothetical protein